MTFSTQSKNLSIISSVTPSLGLIVIVLLTGEGVQAWLLHRLALCSCTAGCARTCWYLLTPISWLDIQALQASPAIRQMRLEVRASVAAVRAETGRETGEGEAEAEAE